MDAIVHAEEISTLRQKWLNASDGDKNHLALALRGVIEITNVLPPPRDQDVQVHIMAITYMLLFLLGSCGNVAVLTTIYHVVRFRRAKVDNTLLYVIVLSCVDFGVCLSLPFTVIDQVLGFWMFGLVVCKLHAVLENVGKILSALIITAMSFDRYASVCHPQSRWMRSRALAVSTLIGLAMYALATLCPMLWSFKTREFILYEKMTGPYKMTRMHIMKCTMGEIDSALFTMFTVYQCILCYCIPLGLVVYFYSKLLTHLRQHTRHFKSTRIPMVRITLFTMAVAGFYFFCWTPFWVATVFAVYLEHTDERNDDVPAVFVYCMYFIHALPFTNSAINWILYGALNGQLQQRYRKTGADSGDPPHYHNNTTTNTNHLGNNNGESSRAALPSELLSIQQNQNKKLSDSITPMMEQKFNLQRRRLSHAKQQRDNLIAATIDHQIRKSTASQGNNSDDDDNDDDDRLLNGTLMLLIAGDLPSSTGEDGNVTKYCTLKIHGPTFL